MDTTSAKNINIRAFLVKMGITPIRENTYSGMYLSPLRPESEPSFSVNYIDNLWFDHGTGEGGTIIDLVMKLGGCTFHEAMNTLNGRSATFSFQRNILSTPLQSLIITETAPLTNYHLMNYLRERSISPEIAKIHCQEVNYTMGDKSYYAIGFCNDAGGYELRNKYFKGSSSPKTITTVDNGNAICLVFEGFMDYLSYLTLKNAPSLQPDIVVLNSIVNLDKAIGFLRSHETIHCFLDNDEAGKRTFQSINKLGKITIDQSPFYASHKDLNEYLCHLKNSQVQTPGLKPIVKSRLR